MIFATFLEYKFFRKETLVFKNRYFRELLLATASAFHQDEADDQSFNCENYMLHLIYREKITCCI